MLLAVWSPKGGSGTSVVAAAVAVVLARRRGGRLADLSGDQPAILGLAPEPPAPVAGPPSGLAGWLAAGPVAPTEALESLAREVTPGLHLLALGSFAADPLTSVAAEAGAALAAALRDGPPTVADAGLAGYPVQQALVEVADASVVVVRGCYLALRRALGHPLTMRAGGVVLVEEAGRALGPGDVADVLGLPVLARFPVRASVARAVDAGLIAHRLPAPVATPAGALCDLLAARERAA